MPIRFDKSKYRRDYLNRHGSYERKVYSYFKNALDAGSKAVIDHINTEGITLLSPMLPYIIPAEPMRQAYIESYEYIGLSEAKYVEGWLNKLVKRQSKKADGDQIDELAFRSEYYRQLIREYYLYEAGTLIQNVDTTTIERIRSILSDAAAQNMTTFQQADYLVRTLSDPKFNQARALIISRTETTRVSNRAANMAGENADYLTEKEWVYVNDHRTRESHRAVGNKPPVRINDKFEVPKLSGVGIDYMMHPGDISAPADQTIGCRCCEVILPVTDAAGVPVLR